MPRTLTPPRAWSPDSDRSSETATPRRRIGEAILATALLFVIAYGGSWRNSFHFDDSHVIETNPAVRSLGNIPHFFADARTFSSLPDNQTYRPIVTTTLAVDHAIASATTGNGLDPRPYHVTQILLLAFVAALVGLLARQLYTDAASEDDGLDSWVAGAALAAAGLFAVHTANSEVGNYISARSESLSTAGLLGGLLLYLRGGIWRRAHLYLIPMALGALAKTPAVLCAPLLLLWIALVERHVEPAALLSAGGRTAFKHALLQALPAFVVAVALYVFVEGMNPPEQTYGGGSRLQNLWTQAWVSVRYVGLFFFPTGLTADSDWATLPSPWDARVLLGAALFGGSLWIATRMAAARVTRPIALGIVWFWIALAPSAAVPLAEVTNDHRPFLAFVGLTIAAVWCVVLVVRRVADQALAQRVAGTVALLVLSLHVAGTRTRSRVWATEATLWADVVRTSPGNARGLMNFALIAMRGARFGEARALLDSAARLAPGYPLIYVNMAITEDAQGDSTAAFASFQHAIALDQRSADVHRYYARWLGAHGRAPTALHEYALALAARPADVEARRERLVLLAARGTRNDVATEARWLLALDATDQVAVALAANEPSVALAGDSTGARRLTDRWYDAGWALTRAGRHAEAIQAYRQAIAADSSNARALNNLGWSLGALGFFDVALPVLERAAGGAHATALARNNLAWDRAMLARATATPAP